MMEEKTKEPEKRPIFGWGGKPPEKPPEKPNETTSPMPDTSDPDLEGTRTEIRHLGLSAIKNYFGVDPEKLSPEVLKHLHQKARIGMQFEREMSLDKRSVEMNYLRVFRMIAEDKAELKKLIKKSLPRFYPGE